jgi:thioredoxin-like negative regulator of GroEL
VREYDADDDDEVCKQYSVSHLPTFIAIRDGQIVGRVTGASMPDVEKLFTMFDF